MGGFPSIQGYSVANLLRWVPRTGGGPALSGKDDVAHALLVKHKFPEVYDRTRTFLPSKDYLNLRLTGQIAASLDSIQLFWVTDTRDIHNIRYDDALVSRTGLDRSKLPPLRPSTDILGTLLPDVARELGLRQSVPVVMGSADHQSALVGSGAVRDFAAHLYVGTSSWVQCLVPFKKTDVLHSIASLPSAIPGRYQCVNEQDLAGGCLGWLAGRLFDQPAGPEIYKAMDARVSETAPGSGGVIFAPWLNGERSPVDNPHLKGGFLNLSLTSTRSDMIRGGARSDPWCAIFADVLGRTLRRTRDPMAANARGAAFIAAVGIAEMSFDDVPGCVEIDGVFEPALRNRDLYERQFQELMSFYKNRRLRGT